MPQDLAALLVEEGAVSQADIDRAVARQGERGGALDTALLELGLIGEGHLLSFLAHASGLPPAPVGALREVDPRARRVFPARVAERHRLAPFALDGRELSVLAVHPFDAAAVDEIGFMLSLTLVPHVAPEWRVLELIHRLYGGQLPARLAHLGEIVRAEPSAPAPAPEVAQAPAAPPAAPPEPPEEPPAPASAGSVEEAFFAAGDAGGWAQPPEGTPEPAPVPPVGEAPTPEPSPEVAAEVLPEAAPPAEEARSVEPPPAPSGGEDETSFADIEPQRAPAGGFKRDAAEPAEPLLAALEQAVDLYEALWADAPAPGGAPAEGAAPGPAGLPDVPPVEPPGAAAEASPEGAVEEAGPPPAAEAPPEGDAPDEELPPPVLDRSAPPRWSLDDALVALSACHHRDEVVLNVLRFVRDFFEFGALFAVTRDAVVGHDGLGLQEDARSHARATAIYAADPGIVRTVLETLAPYLGPVVRDAAGTNNILDGLWRGTPRTVLLYPVLVGGRPVAVVYADNGEAPVSARRLGDLLLFLSTVGTTFERIIRARKRRRRTGGAPRPPPGPPPEPVSEPQDAASPPEPAPAWMAPPPDVEPPSSGERGLPEPPPSAWSTPADEATPAPEPVEPALDAPPPAEPMAMDSPPEEPEPVEPPPVEPAPDAPPRAEPMAEDPAPVEPEPVEPEPVAAIPPEKPSAPSVESVLAAGGAPAETAAAIAELLLDARSEVSEAARDAVARRRGELALRPVPERLRRAVLSGVGDRPVLAARALGALRDVESIPVLIQAFEGRTPDTAAAVADALALITMQRLGPSPQAWLKWWKENRGHPRVEWVFAALASADRGLRVAAAEELRAAGEPPVRYSPDMVPAELESASRAWWTWWSRQGLRI